MTFNATAPFCHKCTIQEERSGMTIDPVHDYEGTGVSGRLFLRLLRVRHVRD